MSVKLHNLVISPKNGRLVIGEVNKRNQLKSYIDISTPVCNAVIKALTTKPGTYLYKQESTDTETKHYKITCVEMTEKEVETMKRNEKIEAENDRKSLNFFNNLLLSSIGRNNLTFR